jgi:hypothetical protein
MVAMAADQFVNVTYRGLDIGRRLRISQFGPMSAYLEHSTPMPVGTELAIHTDEEVRVPVRVLRVQEQVAGAEKPPGMRVAAARLDDAARAWWNALVTTSDPQIPEPLAGAAEQDTAESAEAGGAGAEVQAEADSELRADADSELRAEADSAEADSAEADAGGAEAGSELQADADSAEADSELQVDADSAEAELQADEPGDAELEIQDARASR